MIMTVQSLNSSLMVDWIRVSVLMSTDAVGSSSNKILLPRSKALDTNENAAKIHTITYGNSLESIAI